MKILSLLLILIFVTSYGQSQLAIHGKKVYTMAGDAITDGVVLVEKGKIIAVGASKSIKIPASYQVKHAQIVTPGIIDAHCVVGFSGILNQPHDQEQLERSAPMQPELRAIDGYNAHDFLITWVRNFGITTLHTGHGPGAIMSGQTMIVKTYGNTVEDAVVIPFAMIAGTLGDGAVSQKGAPGTRSKAIAMLRNELLRVQNAINARNNPKGETDKKPEPSRNLRDEALEKIVKRQVPLLLTVHRHQDILAALRVAKEFNIRIVLDGATEAYMVIKQIKAANVPVIVHPTMYRAYGEKQNLSMETPAILKRAGLKMALQSGYEGYVPKTRVVLFEAAIAVAYGMPFEEALAAITIDAAQILGIDNRVGSIEVGKDADLALYNGDPFEYTTHCTGVVIGGKLLPAEKN